MTRLSPLPSLTSFEVLEVHFYAVFTLLCLCVLSRSCVPVKSILAAANYTIRVKDAGDSGAEGESDLFEILESTDSGVEAEESDVTGAGTVGHMNTLMLVVAIVCGENCLSSILVEPDIVQQIHCSTFTLHYCSIFPCFTHLTWHARIRARARART